jgi:hypothetical protein
MCRVKSFFCCWSLEVGGTILGYMHFLFGLTGFIATSVIAMWILAKRKSDFFLS